MKIHLLAVLAFSYLVKGVMVAQVYEEVWSDDFTSSINSSFWTHQVFSGADTGNNELQYYTARSENSYIENGHLVIEAREEVYNGHQYTR